MTWEPAPLLWSEHRIARRRWRVWLSCDALHPGMFEMRGEALVGCCLRTMGEVYVNITAPLDTLPVIWLHEIMHAALSKTDLPRCEEERVLGELDYRLVPTLAQCGLKVPLPKGWRQLRAWALRKDKT